MHQGVSVKLEDEKIRITLKNALEEIFFFEFGNDITENTNLFKSGIIDSFGYVRFLTFLEKEFNIKFTEKELESDTLISLAKIVEYVSNNDKQGSISFSIKEGSN